MNLGNPDRPVGGLSVPRPDGVEIRPLGRDDLADALALARELYGMPEGDVEPYRPAFDALVNDVDAAPFLAIADGTPAGLIVFRFRRRLNHATFEGWISDLVVREAFRGRGIGRALVGAVIAEWRLRGSHRLTLEVGDDRTAARGLYERVGFREQGRHFEMGPIRVRGLAMPDGIAIRAIEDTDPDFEAVTRLLAELVRPTPTEERMPALRRTYGQHVRRADTGSMLALLDGEPVAFVSLELRQPFFTRAPQAWIGDLVVTERARGRGIGPALLDAAFAEGRRRAAYGVAVESGDAREAAHRLYREAGMSDVGTFQRLDR